VRAVENRKLSDALVLPSDVRAKIEECYEHARDLLSAAELTLDTLPHISYAQSALAIEEIGKAVLLGLEHFSAVVYGDSRSRYAKHLDDHVSKRHFALWMPTVGREVLSSEQIHEFRELAVGMEDVRKAALYVDISPASPPPRDAVDRSTSENLLGLGRSLLELNELRPRRSTEASAELTDPELVEWFVNAASDPEGHHFIFGTESMKKHAELPPQEWVCWLRDSVGRFAAEQLEALQRELTRPAPSDDERHDPKWRITVRLESPSHSMARGTVLRSWNERVEWVQLRTVAKAQARRAWSTAEVFAVDVDFTFSKSIPIDKLGHVGRDVSTKFAIALNLATGGFFWWSIEQDVKSFFEKVVDLEASKELEIGPERELRGDWGRNALSEKDLRIVGVLFPALIDVSWESQFLGLYTQGVAALSKVSVNFRTEQLAFDQFFSCLRQAALYFEDADPEEPWPAALARVSEELFEGPWSELELYLELGGDRAPGPRPATLEHARTMKLLCDMYLQLRLGEVARREIDKLERASSPEQ
jgi:AbiV family abortive infection protein